MERESAKIVSHAFIQNHSEFPKVHLSDSCALIMAPRYLADAPFSAKKSLKPCNARQPPIGLPSRLVLSVVSHCCITCVSVWRNPGAHFSILVCELATNLQLPLQCFHCPLACRRHWLRAPNLELTTDFIEGEK